MSDDLSAYEETPDTGWGLGGLAYQAILHAIAILSIANYFGW